MFQPILNVAQQMNYPDVDQLVLQQILENANIQPIQMNDYKALIDQPGYNGKTYCIASILENPSLLPYVDFHVKDQAITSHYLTAAQHFDSCERAMAVTQTTFAELQVILTQDNIDSLYPASRELRNAAPYGLNNKETKSSYNRLKAFGMTAFALGAIGSISTLVAGFHTKRPLMAAPALPAAVISGLGCFIVNQTNKELSSIQSNEDRLEKANEDFGVLVEKVLEQDQRI